MSIVIAELKILFLLFQLDKAENKPPKLQKWNFTTLTQLKSLGGRGGRRWMDIPEYDYFSQVGLPLCSVYRKRLTDFSRRITTQTLTASEKSMLLIYRVYCTGYLGDLHMKEAASAYFSVLYWKKIPEFSPVK